jgi:hypothetical protein
MMGVVLGNDVMQHQAQMVPQIVMAGPVPATHVDPLPRLPEAKCTAARRG